MRLSRAMDGLSYRLNMLIGRFNRLESLTASDSIDLTEVKIELDNIRMYMGQAICLRHADAIASLKEIPQLLDTPLIDHEDAAVECALWLYESGAAPAKQPDMAYTPYYNHFRDTWSIHLELDCFYGRKDFEFEVNYDGTILKFGEVPSSEILNELAIG